MNAHDGAVTDEGARDRRDEAGELTDDLADDGGFVAGGGAGGAAGNREQAAQHLGGPVIAGIERGPTDIVWVGCLGEGRPGDGDDDQCQEEEFGDAHDGLGGLDRGCHRRMRMVWVRAPWTAREPRGFRPPLRASG